MDGKKSRGDNGHALIHRQRQEDIDQKDTSDMGKNVDRAESERMHSADVKGEELEKSRKRKMRRTGKNEGKFSEVFIFEKTADIVRNETIEERIGI